MAELFADFIVPPLLHSVTLVVGCAIIVAILLAVRPPVNQTTVLAFVPWMVAGGILHVFYQIGIIFGVQLYPPAIAPVFSAPAVYLTTFLGMGLIWLLLTMIISPDKQAVKVPKFLGIIGVGIALPLIGLVIWQGLDPLIAMNPIWPIVGLLVSLVATAVVYLLVGVWRTYVLARARYVGALVIFAHLFDAITTTIGVDILGATERSTAPQAILDFAAGLPTADLLGTGWLFVLIKLLMAVIIVVYFCEDLVEHETQTNLLFAFVVAVGLGPGVHNFFLFVLQPA